jgi:hypothetical protein
VNARQIIANASYGPNELKAIGTAFDDAWSRLAPSVSGRATAIEAARLKLAEILLSLAKHGNFDPKSLADTAVQLMLAGRPKLGP